ncbi:MAG: hypothetical protein ABIP39_07965 [Polyangiaceae bacterium]
MKSILVLAAAFLTPFVLACSSGTKSGDGAACFKAGERACPNDTPYTQAEADACNQCSSQYQTALACDPSGGFTCVGGKSETSKDLTCKPQLDAFETCFVKSVK